MRVPILKPFKYSTDGINQLDAPVGAVRDVPDHLCAGLKAEGFIGAAVRANDPVAPAGNPAARETAAEPGAPETKADDDKPKKPARKK